MSKRIRCADIGMNCDFAAMAESEEDLMELVVEHAERVHQIDEISPELQQKVKDAIEDV